MNKIQGHGIPTKFKAAEAGTIYTDLDTGKRYKCLGLKGFVNQDAVNEPVEYHWQLVHMADDSEIPEGAVELPFGEEENVIDITGMEFVVNISGGNSSLYGTEITHNLNIPLDLGQKWKCIPIWKGTTEAEAQAEELEVKQSADGTLYLGDLDPTDTSSAVYDYHIETNTSIGEKSYIAQGGYSNIKIIGISGTYTEAITHTIPTKYLPEHLQFGTEENIVDITGMRFEDLSNSVIPFELGQVWKVEYSETGVFSGLEVKEMEDGTLYIGDLDAYNPPFYITATKYEVNLSWGRYQMQYLHLVGESGIYTDEPTIHKIDEKYIPSVGGHVITFTSSNGNTTWDTCDIGAETVVGWLMNGENVLAIGTNTENGGEVYNCIHINTETLSTQWLTCYQSGDDAITRKIVSLRPTGCNLTLSTTN